MNILNRLHPLERLYYMLYRYQQPSLSSLTPSYQEVIRYAKRIESLCTPIVMEESILELTLEKILS